MTEIRTVTLTEDELQQIMQKSIVSAFTQMGIDTSAPAEMQRDMAHLRRWRLAVDSAQKQTIISVIAVLTAGLAGALWLGLRTMISPK